MSSVRRDEAAGALVWRQRSAIVASAAFALSLALGASACHAQGGRTSSKFYPDSSDTAETLLRNAASHARDRQWSEAIDIFQRVVEQYGDKVAKLPKDEVGGDPSGDFVLFVDLRRFCQGRLAKLPPEAREIYRKRMDGQAERWYRQGESRRDPASLRRVVEQAFCSSWGDDALELLGDLAFQEGRFGDALAMYRRLVADRADDAMSLVHPDPDVDLARVAAKKVLCRAAGGESLPGPADLEEFARRFPNSSGSLAGRKGPYLEILQKALASDHLAPPAQPDSRWPTFAGAPTRSKVVPNPVDVGSIQWRVKLDRVNPPSAVISYRRMREVNHATTASQERMLAYHPIVLGDQVIVSDGTRVLAYNLNDRPSGPEVNGGPPPGVEVAWKHDPEDGASIPRAGRHNAGVPRHTLTAVGPRIYARMGPANPPSFGMGLGGGRNFIGTEVNSSYIIALDWSAQGRLVWLRKSRDLTLPNRVKDGADRFVSFEGTPVADARNVYVAVSDHREQTATYVMCFDAETGADRWARYLGAGAADANNVLGVGMGFGNQVSTDYGHTLLSLDGPTLYYQTNLGALVAIDAETGSVRWATTYPRQDQLRAGRRDRDLNPAVVHRGMVFVAPSDADQVFAFDAETGRLIWKSDPIPEDLKLTHVLGVAHDRLIATGDRVILFDVKTGKLIQAWPDTGNSIEGFGRGLLAGDKIYWPTRNEIHVLDQKTGLRTDPPIKLQETYRTSGGNLVAGDGYLIVAQPDGMVVLCQNSRLIERYRNEIALAPKRAASHYRLAQTAEALGRDPLALESYENAARYARHDETVDGVPLLETAHEHEHRLLLRLAMKSRRARNWDESAALLTRAAKGARTDEEGLKAQIQLAEVYAEAGKTERAVEVMCRILGEERMRSLAVAADDGHRTMRADILIADRLASVLSRDGRAAYARFDRDARDLLDRARETNDPGLYEAVGRLYPVATVVPEALWELGRLQEAAEHPTAAARAYRQMLLQASSDAWKVRALVRLAAVYEAQGLLISARDCYLQLMERYPKAPLRDDGLTGTAADFAAAALARPLMRQLAAASPRPAVRLPLTRDWHWEAPSRRPFHAISAEGVPPSLDAGRLFLVEGTVIQPIDPRSGKARWSVDLGGPPEWVGYLADKVVAATPHRVAAFDVAHGATIWVYEPDRPSKGRPGPDPFALVDPNGPASPSETALHDFQVVRGRVYCLRGDLKLVALDGESGQVEWSFSSTAGSLGRKLWIGADRVVIQTRKPNQLLILDRENGRPVSRYPLAESEGLERPPVRFDDGHVVIVPDRRTVKLLDLNRGQVDWVYRESADLPVNGPPRIFGDADCLLVLHDGRTLIRLDPLTGAKRWSRLLGTDDLSERPNSVALDNQRFYCVEKLYWMEKRTQVLRAFSLADGSPVWSHHLSGRESNDVDWSITLSDRYVMALPVRSDLADGEADSLPVVLRLRESGALVQRLLFPATVSEATLRLEPGGAVVSSASGVWALRERLPGGPAAPAPIP